MSSLGRHTLSVLTVLNTRIDLSVTVKTIGIKRPFGVVGIKKQYKKVQPQKTPSSTTHKINGWISDFKVVTNLSA